MKNLLAAFVLMLASALFYSPPVKAQLTTKVTVVKDSTISGAFTTIDLPVQSTTKSVEIVATKSSGTISGKAVLEALANDGVNYIGIDSLTLADVQSNFKQFTLPIGLPHAGYRFKVTQTGTGAKLRPIVAWVLRRGG